MIIAITPLPWGRGRRSKAAFRGWGNMKYNDLAREPLSELCGKYLINKTSILRYSDDLWYIYMQTSVAYRLE